MKANIEGGKIALQFKYNESTVNAVRAINGRRWYSAPISIWTIPITKENINTIEKIGFDVEGIRDRLGNEHCSYKKKYVEICEKVRIFYPFLFDFQVEAVTRGIVNNNLLIADSMGLGKTIESYAIADYRIRNKTVDKVVVVCPKGIKIQWAEKIFEFFEVDSEIVEGTKKQRQNCYNTNLSTLIINYEQIRNDFWEISELIKDQMVIFDEASMLKNEKAKRTQLAKELRPKYTLALTGTPVENRLSDVFSIGNIVQDGWMDKYEFWSYCIFEKRYGFNQLVGYTDIDKFTNRLMEITIRRKREDVISELPEKLVYDRFIDMTDFQEWLSALVISEISKKKQCPLAEYVILPMIEDSTELLKLSNAKTISSIDKDTILVESPKLKEMKSIIDEMDDKKIVIFTRFEKMALIIQRELGEGVIGSGKTDKAKAIRDFKNKERFLIATDALAYGTDLGFATSLINFDICWNPARLKQRIDRCYFRFSDSGSLVVTNLISNGLEKYIYDVMSKKNALFEEVTDFSLKDSIMGYLRR